MNRVIKFRAWSEHEELMYLPEYVDEENFYIHPNGEVKFQSEDGSMYERHVGNYFRKGWHLMQYTGLKDKNGVEIYEGDILQNDKGDRAIMDYQRASVGFAPRSYYGGGVKWYYQLNEVIGNIYQHSELLTAQTTP